MKYIFLLSVIITSILYPIKVSASISPEQKELFDGGILYFDYADEQCVSESSVDSPHGDSSIKAFARSPISSTWGISDATVEEWFLKQAGASRVKNKFGINAGNIGQITSAVKTAGVSPVFFYTYTVNEGGGAGGFINHYASDTSGGGLGNATRDAQYLVDTSRNTQLTPSWVDAGNPVDFVPQGIKDAGNADFQSMPVDTIGRSYIPATAATTWEVYYPNGLKKEFNKVQNYGSPLSDMIEGIKSMGGNPLAIGSSASASCPSGDGLSSEGVAKAVEWARKIADNDGYGYGQDTRTTGWQKWQEDPNCVGQCGDFDCSSFLASAFTVAGYFSENPQFTTTTMPGILSKSGFTKIADSEAIEANLQPGDILIDTGHTAMYIGGGQLVHASKNERGGANGGQIGDQTGKEVYTIGLYKTNWNLGVWRATK